MYYASSVSLGYRFGDILQGMPLAIPSISKPPVEVESGIKIDVVIPRFCAILTPCCSIEHSKVAICPLQRIERDWFKNPHFLNDFTIINRLIPPEVFCPPEEWDAVPAADKARAEPAYYFGESFVYPPSEFFPEYPLTYKGEEHKLRHYMIDFRNVQKVSCSVFTRDSKEAPAKILELSVSARAELRNKIVYYYSRVPDEDAVLDAEWE